jgi:hypothetical protein
VNFGQIADIFKSEDYRWVFKDGKRNPTSEEIESVFWKAIDALKAGEDNSQIEVGRLIVKRSGSFFDVYLHVASHKDEADVQ